MTDDDKPQGDQNVRHVPWRDEPEIERFEDGRPKPGSAAEVRVGGSTYRVPEHAAIRHRGGVAYLNVRGRAHVLSERGEIVLTGEQEQAIRSAWSEL